MNNIVPMIKKFKWVRDLLVNPIYNNTIKDYLQHGNISDGNPNPISVLPRHVSLHDGCAHAALPEIP